MSRTRIFTMSRNIQSDLKRQKGKKEEKEETNWHFHSPPPFSRSTDILYLVTVQAKKNCSDSRLYFLYPTCDVTTFVKRHTALQSSAQAMWFAAWHSGHVLRTAMSASDALWRQRRQTHVEAASAECSGLPVATHVANLAPQLAHTLALRTY
jgi:hypothetical protein